MLRLKIRDSRFTCKVANRCVNVRERVEVIEWNKRWSPPFPCCPVSRQCPWKKTLIEKKRHIMVLLPKCSYFKKISAGIFILFLVYSISIKYIDLKCKQSYSTNTILEYDYATLKVLVAEKLFPIFTSLQNSICQ